MRVGTALVMCSIFAGYAAAQPIFTDVNAAMAQEWRDLTPRPVPNSSTGKPTGVQGPAALSALIALGIYSRDGTSEPCTNAALAVSALEQGNPTAKSIYEEGLRLDSKPCPDSKQCGGNMLKELTTAVHPGLANLARSSLVIANLLFTLVGAEMTKAYRGDPVGFDANVFRYIKTNPPRALFWLLSTQQGALTSYANAATQAQMDQAKVSMDRADVGMHTLLVEKVGAVVKAAQDKAVPLQEPLGRADQAKKDADGKVSGAQKDLASAERAVKTAKENAAKDKADKKKVEQDHADLDKANKAVEGAQAALKPLETAAQRAGDVLLKAKADAAPALKELKDATDAQTAAHAALKTAKGALQADQNTASMSAAKVQAAQPDAENAINIMEAYRLWYGVNQGAFSNKAIELVVGTQ